MLLATTFSVIGIVLLSLLGLTIFIVIASVFGGTRNNFDLEAILAEDKADPYNLFDVQECFLSWVRSCKTREQVEQMEKNIVPFVVKRFKGKRTDYELSEAIDTITDAIIKKKCNVGKYVFLNSWVKKASIPTLAYSLNNHNDGTQTT